MVFFSRLFFLCFNLGEFFFGNLFFVLCVCRRLAMAATIRNDFRESSRKCGHGAEHSKRNRPKNEVMKYMAHFISTVVVGEKKVAAR